MEAFAPLVASTAVGVIIAEAAFDHVDDPPATVTVGLTWSILAIDTAGGAVVDGTVDHGPVLPRLSTPRNTIQVVPSVVTGTEVAVAGRDQLAPKSVDFSYW